MIRLFTRVLAGASLLLTAASAQAQISILQDYKNYSSAPIGSYQGVAFREGGLSGLFPIPGTNGQEFWTCSDRGVNIDCSSANPTACRPTYDKMFVFPGYAPKIHRIRLSGDSLQILSTKLVKRPNGTAARGVLLPTSLGSTATEVASTDTVQDCAAFSAKTTTKDTFSIDCEGIVLDRNGNFWLCEENGPTIWKLDSNGMALARYTPYATLGGKQGVDVAIDTVFKYRRNNRGFEDIALAPNGKIYVAIQSPLQFPTAAVGNASRVHRILELDPATGAQRMLAYLNDGVVGASGTNQIRLQDWKLSDMAAVNDSTFLIIEAAARGTTDIKRIYTINIAKATAITSAAYGTTSVEGLVDSAGLAGQGIVPVKKTLFMDLLAQGWPAVLDKAEGIAILNDSTLAIGNDNDYGQNSPAANGIPTATNTVSHVIVFRLQGANKIQNLLQAAPTTPPNNPAPNPSAVPATTAPAFGTALFPTPAQGDAVLRVTLTEAAPVQVRVVDAEGRTVLALPETRLLPGEHALTLPAATLPNGLYVVHTTAGTHRSTAKLVVLH